MELRDFLAILGRRKFLILGVGFGIFACWYWATLFREAPLYLATAKVLHTYFTPREYIFRTTTGKTIRQYISLADRLELAKSEEVAELARKYLREGAELREEARLPIRLQRYPEITLEYIMTNTQVSPPAKGKYAFYISARSEDPQLSVDLANSLAFALKATLKELVTVKLKGIIQAYKDRIKMLSEELIEKERALKEIKRELGFDPESRRLDQELARARDLKITLERDLIEKEGKLAGLLSMLEEAHKKSQKLQKGEGVSVDVKKTKRYMEIEAQILLQQARLFELRRKYKEDHPSVQEALRRIVYLLVRLDEEEKEAKRLLPRLLEEKKKELLAENEKYIKSLDKKIISQRKEMEAIRKSILAQKGRIKQLEEMLKVFNKKRDVYFSQLEEVRSTKARLGSEIKRKLALEEEYSLMPELLIVQSPAKDAIFEGKKSSSLIPFVILICLIVGIGLGYIAEYLDDRVKTAYDIKKYLNWQTIGVVPVVKTPEELLIKVGLKSPVFEIYGQIAAILGMISKKEGARTFSFISIAQQEGKSTIATNTAVAFARMGKDVVLVDADLRRPVLHRFLGIENTTGLSTYLSGRLGARIALREIGEEPIFEDENPQKPEDLLEALLKRTSVEKLSLIPSGPIPANPVELLESESMKELLLLLSQRFDFVILDSPPVEGAVDPLILSSITDRAILVVSCFTTRRYQLSWGKRMLEEIGARIAGVVLNRSRVKTRGYYYYYYGAKSYVERESGA
jgi:Mrp family chromosome partitioning ATPase/capsular polysaccharide biosynthesis protein